MRRSVLSVCALAAFFHPNTAVPAPGDILVKLRATYNVQSSGDTVSATVNNVSYTTKAKNAIGVEASATIALTDRIAAEINFGGSTYKFEDSKGHALASSGLITPGLIMQYNFTDKGLVRPYVGVGAAYVHFYSEKAEEILTNQVTVPPSNYAIKLTSTLAPVGQLGANLWVSDRYYINLDAKYFHANPKITIAQAGSTKTSPYGMDTFQLAAGMGFKF